MPSDTPEKTFDDSAGHGQAALFLVESLIHALVARSALSVGEAVDIVDVALDAQTAVIDAVAAPTLGMRHAVTLLSGIVGSLRLDLAE